MKTNTFDLERWLHNQFDNPYVQLVTISFVVLMLIVVVRRLVMLSRSDQR